MTTRNRQVARNMSFGVLICASLAACAVTQKDTEKMSEAPLSQQADPACDADCREEDGTNRYQYYLGILSVFILG